MQPAIRLIPRVGRGVGLGHFMRCLALGTKLRDRGASDIAFLLPPGAAESGILRRTGMEAKALEAGRVLAGDRVYVVDVELPRIEWPFRFASRPRAVVAIDDIGLDLPDVDLIVNPNVHADPVWYREGPILATGPKFAPLRREFTEARRRRRTTRERGRRVVVSMGGGDVTRWTERVLWGLGDMAGQVDVMVGPGSRGSIRKPDGPEAEIRVHHDPPRPAIHFLEADLAITGGGSTLYETAACGTPSLAISINAAQDVHARRWEELGAIRYLGPAGELTPGDVRRNTRALLADPARRRRMSRIGRSLVDGQGADRVATMLFKILAHSRAIRP